jgi:hypothetical protein
MNWRKREDHPRLFANRETMLVAVPVTDLRYHPPKPSWEIAVITIRCDEDFFDVLLDGALWGWNWSDVSFWIPIVEVEP